MRYRLHSTLTSSYSKEKLKDGEKSFEGESIGLYVPNVA